MTGQGENNKAEFSTASTAIDKAVCTSHNDENSQCLFDDHAKG